MQQARSWRSLRDRLLSSPRFQRWAIRFPPTRRIARRQARTLFDLCAGFVYSQVLFSCVTLRLFDHLARGPQSLLQLAQLMALDAKAAAQLLDAARSLDLVETRRDGLYALGPLGAALRGNPGVAAMIRHHQTLYQDLADPIALLRGEPASRRLSAYWSYAGRADPSALSADDTAPYTALMAQTQAMIASEVLDAYRMDRHKVLLDVGGGDGSFLAAAAAQAPDLRLMLFDLPPVAAEARLNLARRGLAARATAFGGDFRTDPLPRGADVASLVRVIHDHDDATALAILRSVRQALPDNGTLILAEPMAETAGARPIGHAYFGFYLLAMGQGRPRTPATLAAMMQTAGFRRATPIRTAMPMLTGLLIGQV